jgi:hypothetical protein
MPNEVTSGDVVKIIAAVFGILTGVASLTERGRKLFKGLWRRLVRKRPRLPSETIRLVPKDRLNQFTSQEIGGEQYLHVTGEFFVTNITDLNILVCSIIAPQFPNLDMSSFTTVDGHTIGKSSIPPGVTTDISIVFFGKADTPGNSSSLVLDFVFIDQLGNSHRCRRVKFARRIPKRKEQSAPVDEIVSDIAHPVERTVVSVLMAEADRYHNCGRTAGGLGSICTKYRGAEYHGVGSDSWAVGSAKLQSLVENPVDAEIESEHATSLIVYYQSLGPEDKELFVKTMLDRLSKEGYRAYVGYFVFFVLFRIGKMKEALEKAKVDLQGDSVYGFSNILMLLDGLLKYRYTMFSEAMLDEIEQCLKDVREHKFKIAERITAIRATRVAGSGL